MGDSWHDLLAKAVCVQEKQRGEENGGCGFTGITGEIAARLLCMHSLTGRGFYGSLDLFKGMYTGAIWKGTSRLQVKWERCAFRHAPREERQRMARNGLHEREPSLPFILFFSPLQPW